MTCCTPGCGQRGDHVVTDPEPVPSTQNLVLVVCQRCGQAAKQSGYSVRRAPHR